jgi:hypothetical protein
MRVERGAQFFLIEKVLQRKVPLRAAMTAQVLLGHAPHEHIRHHVD